MTALSNHIILVGHGRVGQYITEATPSSTTAMLVIEDNRDLVEDLRKHGHEALSGNAADPEVLHAANLTGARCLLVAIPDAFEGGQVVAQARQASQTLPIIARAHSQTEIEHLKKHGATVVVMGEHEIAKAMLALIAPVQVAPAIE